MDSLEYIDSYFGGEFPQEETSRFEKRMQEDPAFAEEVAYYLGIRTALKEVNHEERKARFRELYRQGTRPAEARRINPRRWLPVAAAAVPLTMVVFSWPPFWKPADSSILAGPFIQAKSDRV